MSFDIRKFLVENELTTASRLNKKAKNLIKENYIDLKPIHSLREAVGSITVLRDLFYFDKLGTLAAKEDVDEKYYKHSTLWAKKGDTFDTNSEEHDMIMNSSRLKKGKDYTTGQTNSLREDTLEDEDDDLEDMESDEEELDFMSPGKKDEFDTDDDVEPTAKDIKKGGMDDMFADTDEEKNLAELEKDLKAMFKAYKAGQMTKNEYIPAAKELTNLIKAARAKQIEDEEDDDMI